MALDQKLRKDGAVIKLEGIEDIDTARNFVCVKRKFECCDRCLELEEKSKKAEERCILLELEIEKKKTEFELLEGGRAVLELEKLAIVDEARLLKRRNEELEDRITSIRSSNGVIAEERKDLEDDVDLTDNAVLELMIENKVLECEKKKAESDVEVWKEKCKELVLRVIEFEKSFSSTDRECKLAGKTKGGPVLPGTCKRGISEVNGLTDGFRDAATPVVDILCSNLKHVDGTKRVNLRENAPEYGNRARKQLVFKEDGIPSKKMAPVTPVGARPAPVDFIDLSDSDNEVDCTNGHRHESQTRKRAHGSTDLGGEVTPDKKELCSKSNLTRILDQSDEDNVTWYGGNAHSILTKRKRAFNIITSDSESDTDDNVPISWLKTDKVHESRVPSLWKSNSRSASTSKDREGGSVARRRLAALRKCEHMGTSKKSSHGSLKSTGNEYARGIPTDGTSTDDEADSEGESLNGFIVSGSDFSEDHETSKGGETSNNNERSASDDCSGESEDTSDSSVDYDGIIARIRRQKDHVVKWEFEADMLAAFGKDPELCMRAVCALYRWQTSDEKMSKATLYLNQRGFSQCDAPRGSRLGEFLTDGDPQGDLKKSAKELQEYESKGVELCRSLATHYSKQLFAMYENREDPLWLALETK